MHCCSIKANDGSDDDDTGGGDGFDTFLFFFFFGLEFDGIKTRLGFGFPFLRGITLLLLLLLEEEEDGEQTKVSVVLGETAKTVRVVATVGIGLFLGLGFTMRPNLWWMNPL